MSKDFVTGVAYFLLGGVAVVLFILSSLYGISNA